MQKTKVAVLFGGRSGEHEVSLVSAASVIKAANKDKYEITEIGITEDGKWLTGPDCLSKFKSKNFAPAPTNSNDAELTPVDLASLETDIIFPVLHGSYGEDGKLQGMLEMYNIPYVGCGVTASAVAMDKDFCKRLVNSTTGVKVVDWQVVTANEPLETLKFNFPVFIKPARLGSAVGVAKAKNQEELEQALKNAFEYDHKVLIEKAMDIREIEVAVLGDEKITVSEPGEVIVGGEFYDFNDKYVNGVSSTQIPADLPAETANTIKSHAAAIFQALELRGLSRIDFFLDRQTGEIYLNEINTLPGFTSISMYPKLMEHAGIPYSEQIDRLIEIGFSEHNKRNTLKLNFSSGSDWYE